MRKKQLQMNFNQIAIGNTSNRKNRPLALFREQYLMIALMLLFFLSTSVNLDAQTVLATEDFDGGGVGYTVTSDFNNGTGNNHFSDTDGSDISNVSGPYSFVGAGNIFWAAENTDDPAGNGADEQRLATNDFDITGYEDIMVCIDMAAGNEGLGNLGTYDDADYIQVQFNTDDQPLYRDAINFAWKPNMFDPSDSFNEPLHHDVNRDGDGSDGPQIVTTAQNFCYTIPNMFTADVNATMMSIRVLVHLDANSEEAAFDNIVVTGTMPCETNPPTVTCTEFSMTYSDCPVGLGPNTPNGIWTPIGPTGGINNAVGGSYGLFLDLTTCVTDDVSDLEDMEYTLLDSYSENVVPGCSITLVNEWQIRDECGNVSPDLVVFKGTIAFDGTAPPVITCPANIGVECGESIDPADIGMATATASCGSATVTFMDSEAPACGSTAVITRTWTATDGCGLTATCDQIITTFDTEDPVPPTAPAPAIVECDAVPMAEVLMANDACEGMIMGVPADMIMDGACANSYTIMRTWTFDDECGNSSDVSQMITVEDTTPPDVTCAEFSATFNRCPDPLGPNTPSGNWITIPASGTFLTAVGGSSIGTIDLNGCVTDNCGDFASMGLEYMVSDSYEENRIPGCQVDIINEFMIRDICGNVSPVKFNFRGMIRFDGPAPVIVCPANAMLECGESIDPMNTGMAMATSECGTPAVTFVDGATTITCGNAGSFVRTWTATDGCGQMSTCEQTITLVDTTVPDVTCAEFTMTFSGCPDPIGPNTPSGNWISMPSNGMVGTAVGGVYTTTLDFSTCLADNCSDLGDLEFMISDSYEENRVPGCSVDIINEYMFRDDCGNVSPVKVNFRGTIQFDGPAPTIVCPASRIVECAADISVSASDAVVFSDCGVPSVAVVGPVISGAPDCPLTTYTYTYTATDGCGRTSSCEQVFTILNDGPTIVCPADQFVECAADIVANPDDAVVTTSCTLGFNTVVTGPTIDGQPDCPGTMYTYMYTTTDDCGRMAECKRVFIIQNDGPMVTCPADQVVQCVEDIVTDVNDLVVTTSCGLGYSAYIKQPLITGGIPGCDGTVYTYIYVVLDECGREAECEQQFLIQNDAPTVTVPAGGTVTCFDDIQVSPSDATVVTDCPSDTYVVNVLQPVLNGPANCPGTTYTFTYRVKDNCNRIVEVDRVFTIGNNDAPTITAPADGTVNCLGSVNVNPDNATVTTACGNGTGYQVEVTGPQIFGPTDCPNTTYRYTYTVTDACGRTASDIRNLTVSNDPPVFYGCDEDNWLQFNCEDYGGEDGTIAAIEAYIASVEAYTSCGVQLPVINNFNSNNINTCINNGINTITFRATDNCGRTSFCTTTYVVVDTEAPKVYQDAEDHWEICNYNSPQNFQAWVNNNGGAEAYDGCSNENVSWSTIPSNPSFNCMGASGVTSVTVTFVVQDNCGNSTSTTATFNAFMGGGDLVENDEGQTQEDKGVFELYQNSPNPFKQETMISFNLPEAQEASLIIYDLSGKTLKTIQGDFVQGYNEVSINRSALPGSGVLIYRLITPTESATMKMILSN